MLRKVDASVHFDLREKMIRTLTSLSVDYVGDPVYDAINFGCDYNLHIRYAFKISIKRQIDYNYKNADCSSHRKSQMSLH